MQFKDETALNAAVRGVFKTWGWGCVHVREADTPGVLDLVAWKEPHRIWWIELKIDDEAVRASQLEFIRNNPRVSSVFRWHTVTEIMEVTLQSRTKLMSWPEFAGWISEL